MRCAHCWTAVVVVYQSVGRPRLLLVGIYIDYFELAADGFGWYRTKNIVIVV